MRAQSGLVLYSMQYLKVQKDVFSYAELTIGKSGIVSWSMLKRNRTAMPQHWKTLAILALVFTCSSSISDSCHRHG